MQPQNHTYSSENQLDFSSALMRATSTEPFSAINNLQEDFDHIKANQNIADNGIRENRNISSILTNIRDDVSTPSYAEKNTSHNNVPKTAATDTKPSAPVPAKIRAESPVASPFQVTQENQNDFFHDDNAIIKKPRLSLWQPLALSLALTIIVIMGYNLFQLHAQTSQLQLSLSRYEESIDELRSTQKSTTDQALNSSSVNDDLTHLKHQLASIQSGLADYDSRIKQSDMVNLTPQLQEINTIKQDISDMQLLLETTRNQIADISTARDKSSVTTAGKTNSVTSNRWGVNLASLSSKEQVQIGLSMLKKSGKVPVVQEIVVNGATVYRLSVEGFATRKEALQFISTANKKYGFDGGWVRQS